ncbi:Apoptosis inhibitor 5 [Rhynchospora pubera]|uniref:Apoptosis inhibitor 5 n=1 Tax=Rhynchospora pubera TaxID=906938 RepID=A0AAV8DUL3_9POAL|nr:Apoptosis inhibitor 5 [Rhynchospora pubera]KAJ4781859.1 Apoptosis inhibitor 5 [Rhynchospora pubera]KAJ4788770.1 Apoptosis inhibitor 5 [Rhynchospora pubera]KAJ4808291.1 Apoptosis inhibitor 5 [Rhynchospora pubera]
MAADPADAAEVEKLYEFGERLNEAKDKSEHVGDYEGIIAAVKGQSVKAKQLAAQLIPRFFKHFPTLAADAMMAQFDLIEEDELAIRVQAIRGLPLLCKDTPGYVPKIVDVLGQILGSEENVERDAVHKALMSLLRQDVKASLTALFHHIERESEDNNVREKVICFLKDKVFPLKTELLRPQDEMERFVTDLVKKSLQDVTGLEFKLFIDFLKSFKMFGDGASPENIRELIEIIEAQADLDAQFNVADVDHIDRLVSCMYMALTFYTKGASSSKFVSYCNKHIIPVLDKLPEEKRISLLKTVAASSKYASAQDSRQLLPSIVQLLRKYMPGKKAEDMSYDYVECLLYAFHHLAHKTPNTTNSLCGYKIVTGQPSDRLGEDFSENYKDFTERLTATEETVRQTMKKLTQGMSEHNKALSAAKTDEAKSNIKSEQQKTTTKLRICNNILSMTKPLHVKTPSFIGDDKISLSWLEPAKKPQASSAGSSVKRPQSSTNGSNTVKKGRFDGGNQNQLMNRAFEGISRGGGSNRGRGWGGKGRGRGYR